jgi:DNA-binding ferritin-like protein (Dps family)
MVSNEIVSMQNKNYKNECRKYHKNVNYLPRQYKPRNRNIRKQNASVLTEEVHIIKSWKKIFPD